MKTPTPLTDQFLSDLKSRMEHLKIKKIKLAQDVGTSKQNVNKWFHNVQKPSGEFVLKIQAWLKGVNVL